MTLMTLVDFIQNVNDALRGTDDEAPSTGDDDWNYWGRTANRKKNEMYDDDSQNWQSAWSEAAPIEPGTVATVATTALVGTGTKFLDYRIGDKITVSGETQRTILTITDDTHLTVSVAFANTASLKTFTRQIIVAAGVQNYNMHRSLISLSDEIIILGTDGQYYYIDVVKPQERSRSKREVYLSGKRPQIATVSTTIVAGENIIGGTLIPAGYYRPDNMDFTDTADEVPCDDPYWLVLATAAQIAFNDITYEDKFEDLNGQANVLYRNMARKNRRGTFKNPRVTPVKVQRIRGFR